MGQGAQRYRRAQQANKQFDIYFAIGKGGGSASAGPSGERSAATLAALRPLGAPQLKRYETGNAITPAGATHDAGQPWTAVGLSAAGKLLADAFAQMEVIHFLINESGRCPDPA